MIRINDPNHPVILFIPEAGIYPFIRGLCVLGDAVSKQGGTVYITRDTGQMLRSPIHAMLRLPVNTSKSNKKLINKLSEKYIKEVSKNYGFSTIELSDYVDDKLFRKINLLVDKKINNLKDIKYMGFPVGQIAEYDFVLETKFPFTANMDIKHKELYAVYVKNTALTVAITDRLCKVYKPSLILTFNEYAQGQAAHFGAKINKVERMAITYPVHFNIDASKFSIWKNNYQSWRYKHCQNWNKWKNTPICKGDVIECWKDCVFRMYGYGSHIFSSVKRNNIEGIFNKLKLDQSKKTIVVFTSSQDERISGEISMKIWGEKNKVVDVFSDQIEWLSMLRDYAFKRKNIQIIVRIHPREGIRQFGFDSGFLLKLKKKFKKDKTNFKIIWPDDPVSSYDLLEFTDVCLVAWSLMGQEAARLGIPVLSYTSNMFYPNDDFIQVATTREEYEKKLNFILEMKNTWQHLVKAIRFYHWRTFIPSLNLEETVTKDFDDNSVWPKAPPSKLEVINNILSGKQDLIKYNIKKWKDTLPADAFYQESKAIKFGIRWFLDKTFYPQKNYIFFRIWRYFLLKINSNIRILPSNKKFIDYRLKYSGDISKLNNYVKETRKNTKLRIFVGNGLQVILVNKGKVLRRMSPMVIRLAKLHEYN